MTRYRTIVADPPWPGRDWWVGGGRRAGESSGCSKVYGPTEPTYDLMTLDDICALPISGMAAAAAHLYLWVPDLHLVEGNAARVARAWDFEPGRLIVWRKKNWGAGRFPRPAHEAFVVCRRGDLPFRICDEPSVQDWKQPYIGRSKIHSAKPDGMLDLVEKASPGPYLEMFARRARFGWDYWGNESLGTAKMVA
jgi:N6-adenosine-specific RNA methylase IME4